MDVFKFQTVALVCLNFIEFVQSVQRYVQIFTSIFFFFNYNVMCFDFLKNYKKNRTQIVAFYISVQLDLDMRTTTCPPLLTTASARSSVSNSGCGILSPTSGDVSTATKLDVMSTLFLAA